VVGLRSSLSGDAGSEDEKGEEVVRFAFVAQGQAAISLNQAIVFDHSAVYAESVFGFDAFAGDADLDVVVADPVS